MEEGHKLFEVELAVLAVKVEDEGDWSEGEELYPSGFAVKLEILDE